jgi:uncharacterized protein with von Willebrand factor type A (vWA) domain
MRITLVFALLAALVASTEAAPKKRAAAAVVLLIDRSGSMQGVKLSTTMAAVKAAIGALAADDQIGVITFDSEANTVIALQPVGKDPKQRDKALDKVDAGGGTDFSPALKSAYAMLETSKAATKHVILLSDGEAPSDGLADLVAGMRRSHITLSTIGVPGSDRAIMEMLANAGAGRLYLVGDMTKLATVLVKEVQLAVGP